MITPKFAWNPGDGIVDFTPTWPPTGKTPFSPLEATRHDSITSSGIKQSVLERIDQFVALNFVTVPESDMETWFQFFSYALGGGELTYYPDSTDETTSSECTMEDTDWKPKRVSPGIYSFSFTLRIGVETFFHFS